MTTMNKKLLVGGLSTAGAAVVIAGLIVFGVNAQAGAGDAPAPTPIVETGTPSPSPTITPTSTPTPTVAPVPAPAPADPAPAPDDTATQSDPQQSDPAPADPAPADPAPAPAPATCPGGSTVYSADDAGNATACLPNVCLTLPSMPDPNHPECDAPFRP